MNVSGILVIASPGHVDEVCETLGAMTGIDVHYIDNDSGRIVITQEAETISDEVEGLKRIRTLPHITLAEMSSHYFEEDRELLEGIPEDLDDDSLQKAVPPYLND